MESLIALVKSFLAVQIVVYKLILSSIIQGRPRFFLPLSLVANGVTGVHFRSHDTSNRLSCALLDPVHHLTAVHSQTQRYDASDGGCTYSISIHDIINLKLVPLYTVAAQAITHPFIDIIADSDRCCSFPSRSATSSSRRNTRAPMLMCQF